MILLSKPASSTVVNPYCKHNFSASKSASIETSGVVSGKVFPINRIGASTIIPVGSPFSKTISPPATLVFEVIPANSKAFELTNIA